MRYASRASGSKRGRSHDLTASSDHDWLWAPWGGVEGNGNDRPRTSGGLVSARIVSCLGSEPLFAGLVDPSTDANVVCFDKLSCDGQRVPIDALRFISAGTGFGGAGVIDGGEGGLVPGFEGREIDWSLVDLVEEELLRVWVERVGIGPALANWWVLIGELWVNVDCWTLFGAVDGEQGATHVRLD